MKKSLLFLCGLIIVLISSCMAKNSIQTTPKREPRVSQSSETAVEPVSLINPDGITMSERLLVPEGYKRTHEEAGSFGAFLREYRMEPDGSPVLLYNSGKKTGHE